MAMKSAVDALSPSSFQTMFRPPINRAMRVLDRSFFKKQIPISAAHVFETRNISKIKAELERSKEILRIGRLAPIQLVPERDGLKPGTKCLMLRPEVKHDDPSTWSLKLQELIKAEELRVIPYTLELDYDHWAYHDIMSSILPEDEQIELPTGFAITGHIESDPGRTFIAHLNLRDQYLRYKHLIATVLLDKNPAVRTVINKTDDVGNASEFRTFEYEVLAGEPNLNVEVKSENCIFRFDYSKVYWNTRLNTEHHRLAETYFRPGEAICDVMAGVGPFAVPAGKKRCYVWANDLNPDCFDSLADAVHRNKVSRYVRPYNEDGHTFIPKAISSLYQTSLDSLPEPTSEAADPRSCRRPSSPDAGHHNPLPRKSPPKKAPPPPPPPIPPTFSHFVMNLPATSLTFLPSFIGVLAPYANVYNNGLQRDTGDQIPPPPPPQLPLIHAYTFSTKSDDNAEEKVKICEEIGRQLGCRMTVAGEDTVPEHRRTGSREQASVLEDSEATAPQAREKKPLESADAEDEEGKVYIFDVRDVSPAKRMFCASFRLPRSVAFRRPAPVVEEGIS
ncbi:MAG: tRNA(m(1)G37)methyltransferase [Sclerophora amabilis]|nr:MAG: tRNA(m(1)G37)methyltransferase [Sclerophora amabilis]